MLHNPYKTAMLPCATACTTRLARGTYVGTPRAGLHSEHVSQRLARVYLPAILFARRVERNVVRQHAGNKMPGNMPSKATVSREDYHGGHRGPQREAGVSNASEKATDKYRIMHNRVKERGRTGEGALKLVAWFSLPSPSFSSVCLCALCGSLFRLVGILFPASCLTVQLPSSRSAFSWVTASI